MKKIDMHFHSTHSDGRNTPEEILTQAQSQKIEFLALTDHDNISTGFRETAEKYWIQSCESVEISARNYEDEKSLHLTCYTKHFSDDVHDVLNNVREARKGNLQTQIIALQQAGFQITMQELYDFWKSCNRDLSALNKYDIASILYHSDINKQHWIQINKWVDLWLNDFYLRYFKREWENFSAFWVLVPVYEPSLEVCKHIQQSHNAILSIAHPNFTFKKGVNEFVSSLPTYIENAWVNALEINAKATKKWVQTILEEAKKHDLYITFWSDSHKIWHQDSKHGDFGEINPHIDHQIISKEFHKYQHLILD